MSEGDTFDLRIAPVAKRIGDVTIRMLAYNGSIPGPMLKVRQGSEVAIHAINDGDREATVHWHGLAAVYACPMHPEIRGEERDRCPKCKI